MLQMIAPKIPNCFTNYCIMLVVDELLSLNYLFIYLHILPNYQLLWLLWETLVNTALFYLHFPCQSSRSRCEFNKNILWVAAELFSC